MSLELSELLQPEALAIPLEADGPAQAIDRLLERLVASGALAAERREPARTALLARERARSSGLAHGLALPHAVLDGIERIVAALGVARRPIPWATLDETPVQIVVLLLVPPNRLQVHVRVLAGIARLLNDRRLRAELRAAADAAAARAAIERAEAGTGRARD
ncbi:MAG: PTS sugar transporter subunit IIA [Planctomycetota bacterium]|nr:MAG: PTS sugar transporter subunit IIA [Planctomycetota bacterium]